MSHFPLLPAAPSLAAPVVGPASPPRSTLNVCILYEDIHSARRAMGLIDRLIRQVSITVLRPTLWRFDLLQYPVCFREALDEAETSELLIVASKAPDFIQPVVRNWIQMHLDRRAGHGIAIVSLFGRGDDWSLTLEEAPPWCRQTPRE